jgi:transcriptional regulator with XRE-family HTH domain
MRDGRLPINLIDHIFVSEGAEPLDRWAALRKVFIDRRKTLGYGQRRVAEQMGTTQSVLSELESGKTANPGIATMMRWATALHMSLTVLVHFEEVVVQARTETIRLT